MLSNQLSKQAKARESLLILVVFLGIVYLAFQYFYFPKKQQCAKIATEIATVEERQDSIKKLNQALELKFKKMQTEMQKQAAITETTDPKVLMLKEYKKSIYHSISDFFNFVLQKSQQASISTETIKHDLPAENKGYTSTSFSLTFYGKFSNSIDFIKRIEKTQAIITLDKIDIKVSGSDNSQITTNIIGTFFQLEKDNELL